MAAKNVLYINGVLVSPSNLKISKNKLWSPKSGRATSGTWTGDITARKYKLEVTVSHLSEDEAAEILNAVDGDDVTYFKVKFIDPYTKLMKEVSCYSSDTTIDVYNYTVKGITYASVSFSTIGR